MKYERLFKKYLKDLASKTPAPGGGSAGALSFCLGVSLIEMALNLSTDKKDKKLKKLFLSLKKVKDKVLPYIDLDGEVFIRALNAKKDKRKEFCKKLNIIIFNLGKMCVKILSSSDSIEKNIKKYIISDFYIGLSFVKTALISSVKNLEANAKMFGLNNNERINFLSKRLKEFSKC